MCDVKLLIMKTTLDYLEEIYVRMIVLEYEDKRRKAALRGVIRKLKQDKLKTPK